MRASERVKRDDEELARSRRAPAAPHELSPARNAVLDLQRHAGNQAVVAAVQRARAVVPSTAPLSIQRNIGVEIEITKSFPETGMALSPRDECQWKKRDIVFSSETWDLTLDDTPTTAPYNRLGWPAQDGPYRKFHLEFNLHGGGDKKGFADGDFTGLLNAMTSIEAFCADRGGEGTLHDATRGTLLVFYPKAAPEQANIQLTAGASLAGLQAALAGNRDMMGADKSVAGAQNPLLHLATMRSRYKLASAYVPPELVKTKVPEAAKWAKVRAPELPDVALKSLSTMFTMIKTFLTHQAAERLDGNIKEATPLLWKTPLNLFFESADLGPYRDGILPIWDDLVELLFDDFRDPIEHPPGGTPIPVMDWLWDLPDIDRVAEADAGWDESFGGLGALEGGATSADEAQGGQGSFGHPIIEFRSMPSQWVTFKAQLESAVRSLATINTSETPAKQPYAVAQ